MKLHVVIRVVSAILLMVGIAMLTSVIVSIIMKDPLDVILALLYSSIITTAVGTAGMLLFRDKSELGFREGFGIVTFSWLAASMFGSLPFMLVKDKTIERTDYFKAGQAIVLSTTTIETLVLESSRSEKAIILKINSSEPMTVDHSHYHNGDNDGIDQTSMVLTVDKKNLKALLTNLHSKDIAQRDSYITVSSNYYAGMRPVDAFFETMSGFTTTGASVLTEIEHQPKGLLWWRSLTNWLGGMGIVVLSLAILPILGIGGMQLYKAEAPGPISDQLTPRIASSAKFLWLLYVGFTAIEIVFLLFGGMGLFDATCHSFATLATGGFSTKNASVGAFNSPYIEWVIIVFMFIAGTNFALHLRAVTGKKINYFKDDEFRFYFSMVMIAITLIAISLWAVGLYQGDGFISNFSTIIRHASFNLLTIITTTGFATENYNLWPVFAKVLLLVLMFTGACGGSTSGGMKVSRAMLLLRHAIDQLKRCFFPSSIANVRLNDIRIRDDIMQPVLGFFFIYMTLFVVFTFLLCLIEPAFGDLGRDSLGIHYSAIETSFSASVATLCNIGPGIGKVGPYENYAWLAPQSKFLLSIAMLIGRLEVYTVLVLLLPSFWRR